MLLLGAVAMPALAQGESGDVITVRGRVLDIKSRKALENVSVFVSGTGLGTVTNADGVFAIKIKRDVNADELRFTHIGYSNMSMLLTGSDISGLTVYMPPVSYQMPGLVVRSVDPVAIIREALSKTDVNNSMHTDLLTGFYRETVHKRNHYITVSEAVINILKTPYDQGVGRDKVQIHKGRKLVSPRPGDTLSVTLLGGPNLSVNMDPVKNREVIFDDEALAVHKFAMEEPVEIDDRLHYAISVEPAVVMAYPLYYGTVYIDVETKAFSRIELSTDMSDKGKVTRMLLYRKPAGLRFNPQSVDFLITYKIYGGISYLNYVRANIEFRCDWKRRLFSTGYSVVSEMVVTDIDNSSDSVITRRESFDRMQSLSDELGDFYDDNFWEDYNIIEPTTSLENAVEKIRKRWE